MTGALDPIWMQNAACAGVDPELWFPATGQDSRPAKRICRTCPIARNCLSYALSHQVVGIWGGTSEIERRALREVAA